MKKQKDYTIPALLIPFIIAVIFELLMANKASAQFTLSASGGYNTTKGNYFINSEWGASFQKDIEGMNRLYAAGTIKYQFGNAYTPQVIGAHIGYNTFNWGIQPQIGLDFHEVGNPIDNDWNPHIHNPNMPKDGFAFYYGITKWFEHPNTPIGAFINVGISGKMFMPSIGIYLCKINNQ